MSSNIWVYHGYGICTTYIKVKSVEAMEALLQYAPKLQAEIHDDFDICGTVNPTVEDYIDFIDTSDCDCCGLASFLWEVIWEAEGIAMTACDSNDGMDYLIYEPRYPWEMNEKDKLLTEEALRQIFAKYVSILTDEEVTVEYKTVENG